MKKLSEKSARVLYVVLSVGFAYLAIERFRLGEPLAGVAAGLMGIGTLVMARYKSWPAFIGVAVLALIVTMSQALLA